MQNPPGSNQSYLTSDNLDQVADALAEQGWITLPSFLDARLIDDLRADSESKFRQGDFREARIGRGADTKMEKRVRSDEICWFEPTDLSPAQTTLWRELERLISTM